MTKSLCDPTTKDSHGPRPLPTWHHRLYRNCENTEDLLLHFFLSLHNLCILFLYRQQRLNVCLVRILISSTRSRRTMPYMACWTQLLIIKAENTLKSAVRFTEEHRALELAENLNVDAVKQSADRVLGSRHYVWYLGFFSLDLDYKHGYLLASPQLAYQIWTFSMQMTQIILDLPGNVYYYDKVKKI